MAAPGVGPRGRPALASVARVVRLLGAAGSDSPMILDAILAPLIAAVEWALRLLPEGQPLSLPSLAVLWNAIGLVDSLVPIIAPLTVALGLLAFGAVFVVVRLVLTIWNLIYP